jgi:hypothetical protein
MATATKSHQEKVIGALGKRPKSAREVAEKLGLGSPQSVARALGTAVKTGDAVKSDKGYSKP